MLAATAHHAGVATVRARAMVLLGDWDDVELEERIRRLRTHVNRHSEEIDRLQAALEEEIEDRREADAAEGQRREQLEADLKDLGREAAAGGLRLETLGVIFFGVGIILTAFGSLIS